MYYLLNFVFIELENSITVLFKIYSNSIQRQINKQKEIEKRPIDS